jgi:uncharacterized protein (TIGR04255 family)
VVAPVRDPFTPEVVEEVPLARAPLAVVLAQVRFPTNLQFATETSTIGAIQDRLMERYPILDRDHTVAFLIQPTQGVVPQQEEGTVWRFRSKDRLWQVSLSTNFVALDTKNYESRTDFLARLRQVLSVLSEVAAPVECSRVGMRYVNRLTDQKFLDDLSSWVRCEVVGPHSFIPSDFAELTHSICESRFTVGDDRGAQVRWGRLPANAMVDPSFDPVPGPSWIFDFDMFSVHPQTFDPATITKSAESFSEYAYRFFRWASRPNLLSELGGDIDADA